jgi:hypothetical protein
MVDVASAVAIAVFVGVGYSVLRWFRTERKGLNSEWFD